MLTNFYKSIERLFKIDDYTLEYDSTSQVVHRQSKSKYFEEFIKRSRLHLIYWSKFRCFTVEDISDLTEMFRSTREKRI